MHQIFRFPNFISLRFFHGTCTNVCPRTDVLELVQPVLDQLARPAAEPLSFEAEATMTR